MRKSRKFWIVIGVLGLFFSLSGITYAYLRVKKIQTNFNSITVAKCLDIILQNEQDDISLNSAYAISDEVGKTLIPYKFTIKNTCDDPLKVVISLEDLLVANQLEDKYIKAYLTAGTYSTLDKLSNYSLSKVTLDNGVLSHELLSHNLAPNGSMQYSLRLWIDEDTTWDEGKNKSYQGKIVVNATPEPVKVYAFEYTGTYQEFIAPETGLYMIELWGAGGGTASDSLTVYHEDRYGYGGYTKGTIKLEEGEKLYVYVGQGGIGGSRGIDATKTQGQGGTATFNGGGAGGNGDGGHNSLLYSNYRGGHSGGGATDIRYYGSSSLSDADLLWNSDIGLKSRIMVAGGGGGGGIFYSENENGRTFSTYYGSSGGLTGQNGQTLTNTGGTNGKDYSSVAGVAATQTSGNSFGIGGNGNNTGTDGLCHGHSGGGGGYYGGGGAGNTGYDCWIIGGGGGSSYISGHTGCLAITSSVSLSPRTGTNQNVCTEGTTDNICSIHYSGKYFTSTIMIDGDGYTWTNVKSSDAGTNLMPNPLGGYYESGVGHTGNGYAKITNLKVKN